MNPRQELEVLDRDLLRLDAEFVVQLALSGTLSTHDGIGQVGTSLAGDTQRVRAAGVGPHIGEGDLLGSALLEEELVLVVEEEDGECAVEETLVDVGHEMAWDQVSGLYVDRSVGSIQIFLLALPMGLSFSSVTMQTSSMRRICSSSWPERASLLVSMSGKRRSMFSAVMGCAVVVVVVDMVTAINQRNRSNTMSRNAKTVSCLNGVVGSE